MTIPPFLLIDAGNSRIKWSLTEPGARAPLATGVFTHASAAPALAYPDPAPAEPDWAALPAPGGAWISNVAGAAVAAHLHALLDAYWPELPRRIIRARSHQCGVVNHYRNPQQLGSDRWAGLIGARAAYPGESLLIVTLGTATTVEALDAQGQYMGGLIAPGWALMMRALAEHTAQLPEVTLHDACEWAQRCYAGAGTGAAEAIGADFTPSDFTRDTRTSLSEGCLLTQTGLIERAYHDWAPRRLETPIRCIVGGGAADEITAALRIPYTRHDHLVLAGLALIAAETLEEERAAAATALS